MEWNKLALWFVFITMMSVIVCATIYASIDSVNTTETQREIITCRNACSYENTHCIIKCIEALDMERKPGEFDNEHLPKVR